MDPGSAQPWDRRNRQELITGGSTPCVWKNFVGDQALEEINQRGWRLSPYTHFS